ncbi:MAG: ATP synthase F1 subunit delta [Bacteroidales bacterium]|nr:ATP synthase F1 subunit delta [Bacteroidales bacterium]HOK98331.1 ATP synthase F1 subunit delta [Bacteroidales bacterium]HPO65198.1 ATP synthase F1 subunit delta [Bacteroidales bacterium]
MNEALIAGRYTRAMFALAEERNVLDAIKADMEYLYEVYRESEPFRLLLENPVLKPTQKTRIFKEAFAQLHPLTLSTIELVFKNRREEILPFLAMDFIEKYYQARHIARVTVKTPVKLSVENLERIRKVLVDQLRQEIIISTEEDASLLGGFILRISDKEVDASVRRRLKDLQQQLIKTQIK